MKNSAINRIIELFTNNLTKLNIECNISYIEEISCLVHRTMDSSSRNFHNTNHIFTLAKNTDPLQTLACIFHDLVYFQVDQGFPDGTEDLLFEYVRVDNNKVYVKDSFPDNAYFEMCLEIFGMKPGQELSPFAGLNEFLSAFLAAEKLKDTVSTKYLVAIVAIIEGTIPFRASKDDKNSFDQLEQRIRNTAEKYTLSFTEEEIFKIVEQSVHFANTDVENFSYTDHAHFLDNTWTLLPETNTFLKNAKVYKISEYRQVLQKMEGFMNFLNPRTVFHKYREEPTTEKLEDLLNKAARNIEIAREYLKVKLLTIGLIESVAMSTGGDAPISMMLGDAPAYPEEKVNRAENYFPKIEISKDVTCDIDVLALLEKGRAQESNFDIKHSPTSTYLYKKIGREGVDQLYPVIKKAFTGESTFQQILEYADKEIISIIASACSKVAISRKDLLEKFI